MTSITTTALVLKKSSNEGKVSEKYELVNDFQCPALEEDNIAIQVYACCLCRNDNQLLNQQKDPSVGVFPVGSDISGKIIEVGKSVSRFKVGDEVVGIVPPDVNSSGCAKVCVLSQFDVVSKPVSVTDEDAVSVLKDAVKAYTALHYLAKISFGDTILLCNGASGFGLSVVHLARNIGAKVIVTEKNDEGLNFLRRHLKGNESGTVIVDMRSKKLTFVDICMEETGGLGIDCVIDDGVEMYGNSLEESHDDLISFEDNLPLKPHKHDIISSLAVGGRWVTMQCDLQVDFSSILYYYYRQSPGTDLDPPDSNLLFLKCASLHFLFEDSWTLSKSTFKEIIKAYYLL
eukprot:gene17267-8831_t